MDCIFCKIISGKSPCMKVYENNHMLVIMDTANDVDGHMVAFPKKHVKNILDCDADTLMYLMDGVQTVSQHCVKRCGFEGINLLNANDESAGQSVPHFHIHVIPRKTGDNIDAWPDFEGSRQDPAILFHQLKMI